MNLEVFLNYLLKVSNILVRIFLIPIYVSTLGIEAYGLIGFFSTIQATLVFFDLGIGVASNRLIATVLAAGQMDVTFKKLLNSIELIYLFFAVFFGFMIIGFSEIISTKWLTVNDPELNVIVIVKLMGVLFVVSWPKSFYQNRLIGLNKMTTVNLVSIVFLFIQSALMVYVFTGNKAETEQYFQILIAIGIGELVVLRTLEFKSFGFDFKFEFGKKLNHFVKSAINIAILSVLSLFLFQADKWLISRFMSIDKLGLYSLASVIPLTLLTMIYPITASVFPKIVNIENNSVGQALFNKWAKVLFLIITVLFVFFYVNLDFVYVLWLKENSNSEIVLISKILLIGILFHTTTNLIYNLLVANGLTKHLQIGYGISIIAFCIWLFVFKMSLPELAKAWVFMNLTLMICLFNAFRIVFNRIYIEYIISLLRAVVFPAIIFSLGIYLSSVGVTELITLLITGVILGIYSIIRLIILFGRE